MSSKPTTIFTFHHKCYGSRSMSVYVFKTHHTLQFSPQMLQNQIDESICLQNPPHSSVFTTNATEPDRRESMSSKPTTIFNFHHKCYGTRSMRVYVFKTHHNLQFSPQMLRNQIDESLCLQNPPQSLIFTTNATDQNQ